MEKWKNGKMEKLIFPGLTSIIKMSTVTLTFAEAGENFVGNEIIGTIGSCGYTLLDLQNVAAMFPGQSQIYDLTLLCSGLAVSLDPAYILIVKNPFPEATDLYNRMIYSESNNGVDWDRKAFMKGRVCDKHARYNLLFDDLGNLRTSVPQYIKNKCTTQNLVCDPDGNIFKRLPDYTSKEGTIYNYNFFPEMRSLVNRISQFPNSSNIIIEGNCYYDVSKTYISMHGDSERRKVIGYRLGADFPLHYQWYHDCKPVGQKGTFNLTHGDLYMMSDKAVGNDWHCRSKHTLRHAAGFDQVLSKYGKK